MMGNIRRLFVNDVKRITSNMVTLIIVMGLVLLPSIFSWYNILACWDVFGNTDNLTVAVANNDEGYESDLVPLKINLGEQVSSQLRAEEDMNWVFTDSDDAIDGVESGKYYAAVVIPEAFSKDMMTFYSGSGDHAKIVYYSNEKKNVVAPKLTDQGADRVSHKVNEIFAKHISNVALSVASSLSDYADEAGADSRLGELADHVDGLSGQMSQAADVLDSYGAILQSSESLIAGSSDLLAQAGTSADSVAASADDAKQAVASMGDATQTAASALGDALAATSASYDGVAGSVDQAFASGDALAGESTSALRNQASAVGEQISSLEQLKAQIEALRGAGADDGAISPSVDSLLARLQASIDSLGKLQTGLNSAADSIESGNTTTQSQHETVKQLVAQARQSVADLSHDYDSSIKPSLEDLASRVSSMSETLLSSAGDLSAVSQDMAGSAESLEGSIAQAREGLAQAAGKLRTSSGEFGELATGIRAALSSGDVQTLRQVLSADADTLSSILAAPVALDRRAVFPAENFGSQMAPLYATLGLWIGSLLLVVGIRVNVSRAQREELSDWKLHQLYLGRFGVFALLSLLQSTVMAVGNMFFLGVQYANPLLYLLCFWLAGLVFTLICYTLVVSFANLGKAVAVFLLIIQVTSGGGSFPLQMLPDFFQWLSPFLPATHVINAMRAAMMGVYEFDFWIELGKLLLFVVPFLLLGLLLRKPLMRLLNWYVRKTEESKLVC